MRTISLLLIIQLFTLSHVFSAKGERVHYGKINKKDLLAEVCPIDSMAKAYYIIDKEETDFVFNRSFEVYYKRHMRIKILSEEAIDMGKFHFEFFIENGKPIYKLRRIKAQTYNLVNDKIEVSKLDKDSILCFDTGKNTQVVSFNMPKVKAGSVIELSYELSSERLDHLQAWQFQYDVPVLKSNYYIEIPEHFRYSFYPLGQVEIETAQESTTDIISMRNGEVVYMKEAVEFKADNIPALYYTGNKPISDLASRVEFEMKWSNVSGLLLDAITSDYNEGLQYLKAKTWDEVGQDLCESENFGLRLNNAPKFDAIKQKTRFSTDTIVNIYKALKAISTLTDWDGEMSCFANKTIKTTLEEKSANVAEINLSLVALLRDIGYKAYPIVLSTTDNGYIRKYRASISAFNYVIAACEYRNELLLLDATEDLSNINEMPTRCINGDGLLISKGSCRWVQIAN